MTAFQVTFLPDEKTIQVEQGSTIAEAAQRADIFVNNLCGGEGVCGECRVRILKGDFKQDEDTSAFFSQEEINQGFVLACQTRIQSDLEVEIPPESRLEEEQIMTGAAAEAEQRLEALLTCHPRVDISPTVMDPVVAVRGLDLVLGRHYQLHLAVVQPYPTPEIYSVPCTRMVHATQRAKPIQFTQLAGIHGVILVPFHYQAVAARIADDNLVGIRSQCAIGPVGHVAFLDHHTPGTPDRLDRVDKCLRFGRQVPPPDYPTSGCLSFQRRV